MAVTKARVGVRLRRFREERGLTQAALAGALGISPSYVNQLESSQRPMTASVLLKLASVFDADLQQFSGEDADRLVAQLRDVLTDPSVSEQVSMAEIRELAASMPAVGRYVIELHRRFRHGRDVNEALVNRIDSGGVGSMTVPPPLAQEEVQELFYARRNYFPSLDLAAEQIFTQADLAIGDPAAGITDLLARQHGIRVTDLPAGDQPVKRSYDAPTRVLALSPLLNPNQRAFQLATQLAWLELTGEIDQIVAEANLSSDESPAARPDRPGQLLRGRAGAAVPAVPGRRGEPRVRHRAAAAAVPGRLRDGGAPAQHAAAARVARRAVHLRPGGPGRNISKRQSATSFHFSRVGGSCPLWTVYEAFARPTEIQVQLAQMPDGRSYLWIARTVHRRYGGHGTQGKTFAIGLGCDLRHAHRLVYSRGLDLTSPSSLVPIGPGCKVCDRVTCPQRAFPAIGKPLDANPHHGSFIPYATDDAPDPVSSAEP